MQEPNNPDVKSANHLGNRVKYVALSPNDPIEYGDVLIWKNRGVVVGMHVQGTTESTIRDLAPDVTEVVRPEPVMSVLENAALRKELAWVMENYVPATEDIHALAAHKTTIAQLLKEVR